jgi:hypothetical protein
MDDERLRRELDRRAHRAAVPDVWPSVSRRLDERSQPARAARWAPLAGLAGAALILLALVFALPRFDAGPNATTTPGPTHIAQKSASASSTVVQSPNLASPTSGATRIACVPPPRPPGATPWPGVLPTVVDETGLVVGCAESDYLIPYDGPGMPPDVRVANPFGQSGLLAVSLLGRPCIEWTTLTLRAVDDGFDLAAGVRCSDVTSSGGTFQLTLRQPMAAQSVNAHAVDDSLPPLPASPPASVAVSPRPTLTVSPPTQGHIATTATAIAGPLSPRFHSSAVWTGQKLVIWGGTTANLSFAVDSYDDGASFDPESLGWQTIASSPLSPRNRA